MHSNIMHSTHIYTNIRLPPYPNIHTHTYTHAHTQTDYTHTHTHICICVCMCVRMYIYIYKVRKKMPLATLRYFSQKYYFNLKFSFVEEEI